MKGLLNETLSQIVRTKDGSVQDNTASPWFAIDRYGRLLTKAVAKLVGDDSGSDVDVTVDSSGHLQVDVLTSPGVIVQNAIDSTAFDVNGAAFDESSSMTEDYVLDSIELNFSAAESKTITVTTPDGTKLWEDTNTSQHVSLSDINLAINANEQFRVQVTQTSGACTMDCVAKVRTGDAPLSTNTTVTANIRASDSPSVDAFARWRVSNPTTIFDSKQIFDAQPLLWDDQEVSGSGTSSSHSTAAARTRISVSNATAGKRVRQTFMRFNYQPGKSQLILLTARMSSSVDAGIAAAVGQFDDDNGIFFKMDGTTMKAVIRSSVTGSPVDTEVEQSSFNLDTMDGNGASGVTLDPTKTQIIIIDYEWLGVGRVRMGFVVDGIPIYCHEFLHANVLDAVYMSTPNLPLRYEIENLGTGGAVSMDHICSCVMSEGGSQDLGVLRAASTNGIHVDANAADTIYAVLGIRLKSTHLGATVKQVQASMISETADDFEWLLLWNPTVAGTFTYVDETNSAVQVARGATTNTVTGGTLLAGGYASVDQLSIQSQLANAIHLGSAIDGTPDELVFCVRPLSSNADIQGSLNWRELV